MDTFCSVIQKDGAHTRNKVTVQQCFDNIVFTAWKWKGWRNEYHLLALAVGLQWDIYCYFPFSKNTLREEQATDPLKLKELFDKHLPSNHLLYTAPSALRTPDYNTSNPICIYYDGLNHYTGLKQHAENSKTFKPCIQFLLVL